MALAFGPHQPRCSRSPTCDGEPAAAVAAHVDRALPGRRTGHQPRRHAGGPGGTCRTFPGAFEARVVWMHEQPAEGDQPVPAEAHHPAGRRRSSPGCATAWTSTRSPESPRRNWSMNDIGAVTIETTRPLFFDSYRTNRRDRQLHSDRPGQQRDRRRRHDRRAASTGGRGAGRVPRYSNSSSGQPPDARRAIRARRPLPGDHLADGARRSSPTCSRVRLFERGCQVHVVAEDVETSILPELAQLLNAAGLITIFCASTLDTGERDRARELVGDHRFFDFAPQSLDSSDERAAEQICAALERRAIIPQLDGFAGGEGI